MSLPQQETWAIFDADDAAEVMRFWHPWTGLNVNRLTPKRACTEPIITLVGGPLWIAKHSGTYPFCWIDALEAGPGMWP